MERLIHPKVKDMYLISPSGTYLGCTFSSGPCTITHNMGRLSPHKILYKGWILK